MAVEASINSKKATPLYKQNIIGKGITTLDDFNDYSSVRYLLIVDYFITYYDECSFTVIACLPLLAVKLLVKSTSATNFRISYEVKHYVQYCCLSRLPILSIDFNIDHHTAVNL